jgi:hypothetical protein
MDMDKTREQHPENQDVSVPEEVSAQRRRLMRMAMQSAPFVLTLPSGAALANTSVYQCIDSSRTRAPDAAKAISASDKWERVVVEEYSYTVTYTVYVLDDAGGETTDTTTQTAEIYRYLLPEPFDNQKTYVYDSDGQVLIEQGVLDPYEGDALPPHLVRSGDTGYVAPSFIRGEKTGNTVLSLAWFDTYENNVADTDASVLPIGIHPTTTDIGTDPGDATPLDGSCYCSVNPNSDNCTV